MALLIASLLLACECPVTTVAERIAEADAIFRGELSNLSEDAEGSCSGRGSWNFSMLVHEVYKGDVAQRVNVRSVTASADDCGMPVTRTGEFLVFAKKANNFREFHGDLCMGTKRLEEASAELAALGDGSAPTEVGCTSTPPASVAWLLLIVGGGLWRHRRKRKMPG